MSSYTGFLIAPFATGLDTDISPWLLPQDAFKRIVNGHIHHGRIEKRAGYTKLGDLVHNDGVADYNSGLPVMGLERFIDSSNVKEVIAFDTERASKFNPTTNQFNPIDTADIMDNPNEDDYIWSANWASTSSSTSSTLFRLYFTNGRPLSGGLNGIRYYDGGTTTIPYAPSINGLTTINGCKLIFAFKQRLLLLHTFEGSNSYPQRARWCQVQNPDDANVWDDNVAGRGGYFDAPTGDHIISAKFLQDGLVVFFTNSVWTLRSTPDPSIPFRWDKINDFRACDGKMTTEQFDRSVIAVGIRGITATDGVQTSRFDNRIEDFVGDEINNDKFSNVFSKRSFGSRKLWMLYPGIEEDNTNSSLVYDEGSGAFSKYDIDMNVLGYGGAAQDSALDDFAADIGIDDVGENTILDYFYDEGAEIFLGGNLTGEVFKLEDGGDDDGESISFELESAAWNPWMQEGKQAQLGYLDIFVNTHMTTTVTAKFFVNNDTNPYMEKKINLLPNLTEIASVSQITQANPGRVTAGQHGLSTGDEVYLYNVEGMDAANGGPYTVTVLNNNNFTIGVDTSAYDEYVNGGVVTELPFIREKTWKRIYAGGKGYQHRVEFSSSGIDRGLIIEAFMPWFRQTNVRPI